MQILEIATKLLSQKLGNGNEGVVSTALTKLLPMAGGDIELTALLGLFTKGGGGLASLAQTWLGDGGNASISPAQIMSVFGADKIGTLASEIGVSPEDAAGGLSGVIPELLDKASSGGQMKNDVVSGVVSGLAGKLFG